MDARKLEMIRAHATHIIKEHSEDIEFSYVYEDPDVEENDRVAVYDEIRRAKITVTWDD